MFTISKTSLFYCFFVIWQLNVYTAAGQKTTAIFLISRLEGKLCPNKQGLINSIKTYCLEKRPLLTAENFAAISDIYYTPDEEKRQLDIIMTPKGAKMLNSLTMVASNTQVAVVVSDRLVSIINITPPFNSRLINLWDKLDNPDFESIHLELKQSLVKD